MKYQAVMMAAAMIFGGVAVASQSGSASSDEMADYKIECLEAAYGEELTGEQKDKFVEECMQKKLAARKAVTDKKT